MRAAALALLGLALDAGAAAAPRLTILFFTAPWCGPCRAVYPILEKFVRRNRKTIKLIPVDFDVDRPEAGRWGVHEIPVVIVLSEGGRLALRADGAAPETLRALEAGLEKLVKKPRRKRSPP